MLARDSIGGRDGQQGVATPVLIHTPGDYNSCWSALPDPLRSRVECLLELPTDDRVGRYGSQMAAPGQPSCRT